MPVVLRALALVLAAGTRNRVRVQLRRVRQPRYLLATAFGIAYWLFAFGPAMFARAPRASAARAPSSVAELAITGFALLWMLFYWTLGGDKAAVTFSEAEIQFLFPAPLSRRQLLHYRLLRALATSLLGAAFASLFFRRGLSGRPLLFTLGAWIAFSTLSFHGVAAVLTRASLAEARLSAVRRRVLTLAGLAAAIVLLVAGLRQVAPPGPFRPSGAYLDAWAAAVDASPLRWVLWPVRAPVRLALARTGAEFLAALPGALAVLGAHYAWVMSSAVQFEEASVEAAERRARRVEALRTGRGPAAFRASRSRRAPFRLAPAGPPEIAFLWKGLIAGGRVLWSPRTLLVLGSLLAGLAIAAAGIVFESGETRVTIGVLAVTLWVLAVLLGPRIVRSDLRADVDNLEQLRALPLRGKVILRGAILAPALLLCLAQWILLPFMAGGLSVLIDEEPGTITTVVLAAAVLGPALTLAMLVIQNGFLVLFPGWSSASDRPRGPEAIGTNLLGSLAVLVALGIALVPAGATAAALAFALAPLAGGHVAAVGAACAAALVLVVEAWLGTAVLGAAFDRMDVSEP